VAGAVGSVVGAYYYLKIIKTMYFDPPANEIVGRDAASTVDYGLIAVAALLISPLGYLLIKPLAPVTAAAAGALF
jgi:NADH-quinone oxidoreductase subunit N